MGKISHLSYPVHKLHTNSSQLPHSFISSRLRKKKNKLIISYTLISFCGFCRPQIDNNILQLSLCREICTLYILNSFQLVNKLNTEIESETDTKINFSCKLIWFTLLIKLFNLLYFLRKSTVLSIIDNQY